MRRQLGALLAGALAAALAGCADGGADDPAVTPPPIVERSVGRAKYLEHAYDWALDAMLIGKLVVDDGGCLALGSDGRQASLVLPASARVSAEGDEVVVDLGGKEFKTGGEFAAGGGLRPVEADSVCAKPETDVAIIAPPG